MGGKLFKEVEISLFLGALMGDLVGNSRAGMSWGTPPVRGQRLSEEVTRHGFDWHKE